MKLNRSFFMAICAVTMLPGCGRIIDWGKSQFNQGDEVDKIDKRVKNYIRSIRVYDQITTRGIFDAIWLGDEVRTSYSSLFAFRQGKSDEHSKAFLRRQLEENKHFISFYVLSLYEVPLGEANSEWNLVLKVDDALYAPVELKKLELPYEYRLFFGPRHYTRFKESYLVKFNALNMDEKPIIDEETTSIELWFRAADRSVVLCWDLDENGKVK